MHDKMFGEKNLDVIPRWDTWIRPVARTTPVSLPEVVQEPEAVQEPEPTQEPEEPIDSDGEEWIELGDPEDSDYEDEPKVFMFNHNNFRVLEEKTTLRKSLQVQCGKFGNSKDNYTPLSHESRRFQTFIRNYKGSSIVDFNILKIAAELYEQLRSYFKTRTPRSIMFVSNNRMLNYVSWAQPSTPKDGSTCYKIHMNSKEHIHFGHIWCTVVQSIAHFNSLRVKKIDREAVFNKIIKKFIRVDWSPVVFVKNGTYHCLLMCCFKGKNYWYDGNRDSPVKSVPSEFITGALKGADVLTFSGRDHCVRKELGL